MSNHVAISPGEAADRLAIRELVEAYAHCADRRDAKGQMALFTANTHFVVYMNAKDPTPSQELHSREALAPVFADLNGRLSPLPRHLRKGRRGRALCRAPALRGLAGAASPVMIAPPPGQARLVISSC